MAKPGDRTDDTLEQMVVSFAEQIGRMAGTVQARAEGWLDRRRLNDQLTRIRDSAADLLNHIADRTRAAGGKRGSKSGARKAAPDKTEGRSSGAVDTQGKRRRGKAPGVPASSTQTKGSRR